MSAFILSYNGFDANISAYVSMLHARARGYDSFYIKTRFSSRARFRNALKDVVKYQPRTLFITGFALSDSDYGYLENALRSLNGLEELFLTDHRIEQEQAHERVRSIRQQTDAYCSLLPGPRKGSSILALEQYRRHEDRPISEFIGSREGFNPETLDNGLTLLCQYAERSNDFDGEVTNTFEVSRFLEKQYFDMRQYHKGLIYGPQATKNQAMLVDYIGSSLTHLCAQFARGDKGSWSMDTVDWTHKEIAVKHEEMAEFVYNAGLRCVLGNFSHSSIGAYLDEVVRPQDYTSKGADEIKEAMLAAFLLLSDHKFQTFSYGNAHYQGIVLRRSVSIHTVYHLIHTLKFADFVAVYTTDRTVEMRQSPRSPLVLKEIAEDFGGSGYRNSARFNLDSTSADNKGVSPWIRLAIFHQLIDHIRQYANARQ